jgi:hypothetical protein
MTRRFVLMLLPAAALFLSACDVINAELNRVVVRGSGKIVTENRDVTGFHEVDLAGTGELTLDQGSTESLTVEADDNILPKIQTQVRDGRLIIEVEHGYSLQPSGPIRYKVVARELTGVGVSGSGKVLTGNLRCGDLTLRVSGSGALRLNDLAADNLEARISGSGDIEVPGKVNHQEVRISGSGEYHAQQLESQSADVTISGSGDSTVWVRDTLSAHVSGSGDIAYYGSPRVAKRISGSGKVRNVGQEP